MRIYIPLTVQRLRAAVTALGLTADDGLVFAVTGNLREEFPGAAEEDLEYLAMTDAARASLHLLSMSAADSRLRVVAAVDAPEVTERPDRDRSAASIPGPLPWSSVISVHLDSAADTPVIERAAAAVDAAELGDPDAEVAVGDVEDIDLAWYAPAEVMFLLDELAD